MPDSLDLLEDGDSLDLGNIGDAVDENIDCNGQFSLLNHTTYNVSVVHELDGVYDELVTIPMMAAEKAAGILWVLLTSGFFHRVRLGASDDRQRFHLRFCEATMNYQGQLS